MRAELVLESGLSDVRLARLRSVMLAMNVPALLTSDPINIFYATGVQNMTVYSMMLPARFVLVFAEGPVILWEFGGSEHLAAGVSTIDEVRSAPTITATGGRQYLEGMRCWVDEVTALCRDHLGENQLLAVERFDFPVTDALRDAGLRLTDAGPVLGEARRIKHDLEIGAMREAIVHVEAAAMHLVGSIKPGRTEVEVWAEFHRCLMATGGQYVVSRLFQGGQGTCPYFQEAGFRVLEEGDLVCFDTDAIGMHSYAVDFSRTYLCGSETASASQRNLHALALEQLEVNSALLVPGVSYEDLARRAWKVPSQYRPHGYYCIAHGLGLNGEFPYIPHHDPTGPYPIEGALEPGMVICVESYVGSPADGEGVKLEDQFLITDCGHERMTTLPFDKRLSA
jgi:Xaa-Pro dipeptidase